MLVDKEVGEAEEEEGMEESVAVHRRSSLRATTSHRLGPVADRSGLVAGVHQDGQRLMMDNEVKSAEVKLQKAVDLEADSVDPEVNNIESDTLAQLEAKAAAGTLTQRHFIVLVGGQDTVIATFGDGPGIA